MPNEQRPLKVFLCHAHSDKSAVLDLYFRLTKDGVNAWLDKEKLLPGQDWEYEIRRAVRESDVVVVCLSKQFNQAGFRQKEVRLALDTAMEQPEGEIFIIPARLEECDNLESLRKWHWVDLFEDDGYEVLMRALRARANRIGAVLQVKRNWLPKTVTPRKIDKPAPENKPDRTKSDGDGGETATPKTPTSSIRRAQRKPNTAIIVALIGLAGIVIAGLLSSPLIDKWFSPVPTVSATATVTVADPTRAFTLTPVQMPIQFATGTASPADETNVVTGGPVNSQDLYFISGDKYLNVLDSSSRQVQQIVRVDGFNDYLNSAGIYTGEYSTLAWNNDTELVVSLSQEILVLDLTSKTERRISLEGMSDIGISDVSPGGGLKLHNTHSWERSYISMSALPSSGEGNSLLSISRAKADLDRYRSIFCVRQRPKDYIKVALIISELNGSTVGAPSLAIVDVAYGVNYPPVIIKKQVDGCISWSPDGKYIAYGNGKVRYENLAKNFPKGIFYTDFASGTLTKLTDTDGYYPVWSPDGKTIAFITHEGISLVDVSTKEESQVYSGEVLALLWGK